jgi:2-isopropylmalate synthase
MLKEPQNKYQPVETIHLTDRTWVNKTINKPPIWLSTDLRDGNQSLFDPMNGATKLTFFNELIRVGFKEIEIGFPAASEMDFNFVRKLIEEERIPDDVTPMVITQAREDLIKKTVESLKGAKRAIVHIYNATAPAWREIVFGMSVDQMVQLVEKQIRYFKDLTDKYPETEWILQYSPETFSATELEVALKVCNTAIATWDASSDRKIIINLPSTVENSTPNVFADRIEWMDRNLNRRDCVVLSVHPHNDRGTGVATAELAILAGADRVEGCLFGNGERCGNVDLVTLALNLYTQGVHPNLDFSNISKVAKTVEECTKLPIHPRHPYVGDLVFTAFSGSHQDAIKKGFSFQEGRALWNVPYLPIDPKDLGRTYESVIRVNSQSGKGGIAYLLERDFGIVIPRKLQIEFSGEVQRITDSSESEITSNELYQLFEKTYLHKAINTSSTITYKHHKLGEAYGEQLIELVVFINGTETTLIGKGNGPIEATVDALSLPVEIIGYEERAIGSGAEAKAIAIIEMSKSNDGYSKFGAGLDTNIVSASIKAIISAINRLDIQL